MNLSTERAGATARSFMFGYVWPDFHLAGLRVGSVPSCHFLNAKEAKLFYGTAEFAEL
jgi:hypothetical protein